jgi:hypothetical protein
MPNYPIRTGGGEASGPQIMRMWSDPNVVCGTFASITGSLIAYRWNLLTGSYVSIDLATVAGNDLNLPIYVLTDDHFQTGSALDNQDRYHVIGNHHDNNTDGVRPAPNAGMHYLVCNDTTPSGFVNPASWVIPSDTEPGAILDNSSDGATYTYTYFDRGSDGTLYMVQSQSYQRGSSRGRCVLGWTKKDGAAWQPIGQGTVPSSRLMYTYNNATLDVEADRAYCNGLLIVPRPTFDWVIISGSWRTHDSDGDSQQRLLVLYAKSTDLTKWYSMDGTLYQYTTSFNAGFNYRPSDFGSATPSMPVTWFNKVPAEITGQPGRCAQGTLTLMIKDTSSTTDTTPGNVMVRSYNGDSVGGNTVPGTTLPADTWLWYSWNGSAWVRSTAPNLPGAGRDFVIDGVVYARANEGAARRVTLRNTVSNKVHGLGMAINSTTGIGASGSIYGSTPCPIWLREGVFIGCVPVDNVPKLYRLPSGVRI